MPNPTRPRQQRGTLVFPAAAVTIVAAWIVELSSDAEMPEQVAAALTALLGWIAAFFGLSRGD